MDDPNSLSFGLYTFILSFSVAVINNGKYHRVANECKHPGDRKANYQGSVRRIFGIDLIHPEEAEAEHPGHSIDRAEDGISERLDGVA